ncbi:MAG: hypothetical protein ABI876_01345, partial [Bacteroidota bacterium]
CLSIVLDTTFISNELYGSNDSVDPDARLSFSYHPTFTQNRDKQDPAELPAVMKSFKHDIRECINRGTLVVIIRSAEGITKNPLSDLKNLTSHHTMSGDVVQALEKLQRINAELFHFQPDDNQVPHVWGEFKGRGVDDIHWFIQETTGATVLSLYIDPHVLEWMELHEYYEVIKKLADSITNCLPIHKVLVTGNRLHSNLTHSFVE